MHIHTITPFRFLLKETMQARRADRNVPQDVNNRILSLNSDGREVED